MTKLNDAGREIWFARIFWSYMPAHWKGLAITIGGIMAIILTGFLVDKQMSGLFAVPLLGEVAFLIWICERHSPSRR